MPKLIDYPRTSYTSAWEVAEVVDDTGGKCALETCARKLNRKVSGSFKAIIGSAVKFGLLTSKREILTTTTLFRRIKHAYDKQEELLFHREAFLTPALFTQICRKFRSRELPVAMLDVLLIREFDVEEINAQAVAKAFVDGAHMVGVLNENNIVADIDQLAAKQAPRRELASPTPANNTFRQTGAIQPEPKEADDTRQIDENPSPPASPITTASGLTLPPSRPAPAGTGDAIASLFGLGNAASSQVESYPPRTGGTMPVASTVAPATTAFGGNIDSLSGNQRLDMATTTVDDYRANQAIIKTIALPTGNSASQTPLFRLQLTGPGLNTDLDVTDADDLLLVRALLDKIERQLRRPQ